MLVPSLLAASLLLLAPSALAAPIEQRAGAVTVLDAAAQKALVPIANFARCVSLNSDRLLFPLADELRMLSLQRLVLLGGERSELVVRTWAQFPCSDEETSR
jgi:hypothetical protein